MISDQAKEITKRIYSLYGSDSQYLFGISQSLRSSVEAIVQAVIDQLKEDNKHGE